MTSRYRSHGRLLGRVDALRSSTRDLRRVAASRRYDRYACKIRRLGISTTGRAPMRIGQIPTPCALDIGEIYSRDIARSVSGLTCHHAPPSPAKRVSRPVVRCIVSVHRIRIVRGGFVALLRSRVNKRRNGSDGNLKRSRPRRRIRLISPRHATADLAILCSRLRASVSLPRGEILPRRGRANGREGYPPRDTT